jgi:hypothetical protein
MKLTKYQKKTLRFFYSFQTEPPTVVRQLRFNWFACLPLLIFAVLGWMLVLIPGFENAGVLLIGVCAGAFFRDIGRFRALVCVWPIYKEIINWQRVSELLESNEKPDAPKA